jgi:DNA-binding MarR family transcriptional regulator
MTATSASTEPELTAHERLGRAFKAAVIAMRRLRGRETHPGHAGTLSYAQYGLLFGLAEGDELSVRQLAERADLTSATVTQMLDALEAAGLVARQRSGEDRRVVLNSLTERGRELLSERKASLESRWRAVLAGFSDEQLLTAAAVLERLAEHFDRFDGTISAVRGTGLGEPESERPPSNS